MRYAFAFTAHARRQLCAIDQQTAMRILHSLTPLGDDPYQPGLQVRKLAGPDDRYRLRVGDYRIIYRIDDSVLIIEVVQIGHRREVYRH